MKTFLEIAPHAITADAFWYRGTVNLSREMSDSDTDHTLSFARSVVKKKYFVTRVPAQ
jgi:hypothetical protein